MQLRLLRRDERDRLIEPAGEVEYENLRDVLAETGSASIVVLGAPGSGKSTLLRRLLRDEANRLLDDPARVQEDRLFDSDLRVPLLLSLNKYRSRSQSPREWAAAQWQQLVGGSAAYFEEFALEGRILLLLDGLNEIPHADFQEYVHLVDGWRFFLNELRERGNRCVVTCRGLDYSVPLGSVDFGYEVQVVTVQPLDAELIGRFLCEYVRPQHAAEAVFQRIKADPRQLALYGSPYFLTLLTALVQKDGHVPVSRAELVTRFMQAALRRELCDRQTASLRNTELLTMRDQTQITNRRWSEFSLPERGILIPDLTRLAFDLQCEDSRGDGSQVSAPYDRVVEILGHQHADVVMNAGGALGVLHEDLLGDEVRYAHQLLQEYFAGRQFAKNPDFSLVKEEWSLNNVSPTLSEALSRVGVHDRLPSLPSTGWEETVQFAAGMVGELSGRGISNDPAQVEQVNFFIADLMEANLTLAGKVVAVSVPNCSPDLRAEILQRLLVRCQDPCADLRARLAAGTVLGQLGDPRFTQHSGPDAPFLLPPLISVPDGTYEIGDNNGGDRAFPAHSIAVQRFEIGVYPVTNKEFSRFIAAGGYSDERWWQQEDDKRWHSGEISSSAEKSSWRDRVQGLKALSADQFEALAQDRKWAPKLRDDYAQKRSWSQEALEEWLAEQFPKGTRYLHPKFWSDSELNSPSQPVVGISWYEARAYCAWLSAQSDSNFRLASEAEWEIAARVTGSGISSLTDEADWLGRANTVETRINSTSPVGVFSVRNESCTSELFDMSGNVSEWTSTTFRYYPYQQTEAWEAVKDSSAYRVLRGMSWSSRLRDTVITARRMFPPASRANTVGFRLVRAAPLVLDR
ncbi:SUMF1/EgtB/PvdO family nonheme iron enzyme [Streptomyces nigra]|uniref:SUMF1/EgtB/PvdO family nonheme iron enzyme n=1 Tax=Streptomyces nigra TaxID=1827580 RepID=UPI003630B455